VFGTAKEGRADELERWYDVVHGPDAIDNGSFDALHRYRATTPSDARHLAVWEGRYTSMAEAAAYIKPRAAELRAAGRVTDAQTIVHAQMWFLCEASTEAAGDVRSMTTLISDLRVPSPAPVLDLEAWEAGAGFRYSGDGGWPGAAGTHLVLLEHHADVGASPVVGELSFPPRPPYRGLFDVPASGDVGDTGEPAGPGDRRSGGPWVVRWEPVASLRP
jgi:hypothetical protein